MKAQVGSGDFEKPPEGVTQFRCYRIVDLGTQEKTYKGDVSYVRQILITHELPQHMKEFEGETLPMSISKKYRLSFNKKAALRLDMEAWYGKTFNDKDIENSGGFDPTKILGRPGLMTIKYSEDGQYANIASMMNVPEGTTVPDQINPSFIFDLDEFDREKWDLLSQKMQSWIAKSPEAKEVLGTDSKPEQQQAPIDDGFDDIPF